MIAPTVAEMDASIDEAPKKTAHSSRKRLHPCVNKHGWHNLMRKRVAAAKMRKYLLPRPARKIDLGPVTVEGLPVISVWTKIWRFIVKCLDKLLP